MRNARSRSRSRLWVAALTTTSAAAAVASVAVATADAAEATNGPALGLPRQPGAERPRNIIVVLTDDHRHDALGFLGHPWLETPHLDRLAAGGVHFANAYVTTSLCSPSRASILTGRYAHNHGVGDNYNPLPEGLVFFPQYLQRAGYETALVGKWHMGGSIDHPQPGFDHWVSFKGQGIYWPFKVGLKVKGRYVPQVSNEGFNVNGRRVPQKGYITDELTDYALEWLRGRRGEKPFFLFLAHKAAHADFLPANRHAYRYEDKPLPPGVGEAAWAAAGEAVDTPLWVQNQRNSRHGAEFAYYTDLDLAGYYRRYCETLLAVDEGVGRILDWLESSGRLDDTLVLYLGDNGFLFGEHGLIDKRNAYEESVRIPMILHCPALTGNLEGIGEGVARRTEGRPVANIDVAPTLLDAAGLVPPEAMDGRSFLPLSRGDRPGDETAPASAAPWREHVLYEYYWERNYPHTPTTHALLGGRYKYIRYHGVWDVNELYDLQNDPRERRNLINDPAHQDRIARLNRELFAALRATGGTAVPLLPDRGTQFLHRKRGGSKGAPFPGWFYREPDVTGK